MPDKMHTSELVDWSTHLSHTGLIKLISKTSIEATIYVDSLDECGSVSALKT